MIWKKRQIFFPNELDKLQGYTKNSSTPSAALAFALTEFPNIEISDPTEEVTAPTLTPSKK